MKARYVALARVSSREQEREGFSLEVQESALRKYASRNNGEIVKLFRIAETASKRDERTAFKALLVYAREHADKLKGVLFYKVDRAARNIFDYVELERLEAEHDLAVVYVSQPTENSPAGRMQRRILANMASFYTEQQSLDVREGMARRVQSGLFVGHAPFGYRNIRVEGRGLVQVHPENGAKVQRAFELYAYNSLTLDELRRRLWQEGVTYHDSHPKFPRSSLHKILRDRSYIGEVSYRGAWHKGTHEPLVDLGTWSRVQTLLGEKVYRSHEMLYASKLITCAHCGRPITGEVKTRRSKNGVKEYTYYRCTRYNSKGHPRVRLPERELDRQMLELLRSIRIQDAETRRWFGRVLNEKVLAYKKATGERIGPLTRELREVEGMSDRLLSLRLVEEIETDTYRRKSAELAEKADAIKLRIEAAKRGKRENGDIAVKAFELSQMLEDKWLVAENAPKRRIIEALCLNTSLDGVTLRHTIRKPFDVLAEGPISKDGRGERI